MKSKEKQFSLRKPFKNLSLFVLAFTMMLQSLVFAASEDHVVYQVTWISDNSARVSLDWSHEGNDTPIMITGWSVNDNGSVTLLYNQGEDVPEGFDIRTVKDDEMKCPCVFVLVENMRGSESVKFPDLPKSEESMMSINHLYDLGIINGYPDGGFKPSGQVTRAEFSKMLYVAGDMTDNMASPILFSDVRDSHWAKSYIYTLASKGIVNGKGDSLFDPEGTITIGEVLTIMDRSFQLSGDYGSYEGSLAGHWSDVYFNEMVNKGIVQNTDAFYSPYTPDVLATREQCGVLLSRVLRTYYQMK